MIEEDRFEPRMPSANAGQTSVSIHIERLVFEGVQLVPGQAAQLQAAVERELTHLLAGGLAAEFRTSRALDSLMAGTVQLGAESSASQWGQQIAGAVYGRLGR